MKTMDGIVRNGKNVHGSAIVFGKVLFRGHTKNKTPWSRQILETLVCARRPADRRITHEHSTVAAAEPTPGIQKQVRFRTRKTGAGNGQQEPPIRTVLPL